MTSDPSQKKKPGRRVRLTKPQGIRFIIGKKVVCRVTSSVSEFDLGVSGEEFSALLESAVCMVLNSIQHEVPSKKDIN